MSHQGTLHDTTHSEHLQQLVEELIPHETLEDLEFQASALWTPVTLVFAALLWSWSGEKALTERFTQAWRILHHLPEISVNQPPGTSYQGFVKRLKLWHPKLRQRLQKAFRRRMLDDPAARGQIADWLLFAADGSRCQTPRTRSNQQRFAALKKTAKARRKAKGKANAKRKQRPKQSAADRAKKAATPQIWLTALYAVSLGLPWDWRSGPTGSSEREHLLQMVSTLPPRSLLALDAGLVGFAFWKGLIDAEQRFVCRVGSNVKLLNQLGSVRSQEDLVLVWPQKSHRRGTPPLVLRLESFHDGREPVYLVTNVLDARELATADLRSVYRARWGVEVFYRDLKQTFERGKLRSKSADAALLELDWSLLGLWAANLSAWLEHRRAGLDPQRRSVARVLRALRRSMSESRTAPDSGQDLRRLLRTALRDDYHRTKSKASVHYPHKKTKRVLKPPHLVPATPEQLEAAKSFFVLDPRLDGLTA